jgi:hypothetical protein
MALVPYETLARTIAMQCSFHFILSKIVHTTSVMCRSLFSGEESKSVMDNLLHLTKSIWL